MISSFRPGRSDAAAACTARLHGHRNLGLGVARSTGPPRVFFFLLEKRQVRYDAHIGVGKLAISAVCGRATAMPPYRFSRSMADEARGRRRRLLVSCPAARAARLRELPHPATSALRGGDMFVCECDF
jgi:hypothetical protein